MNKVRKLSNEIISKTWKNKGYENFKMFELDKYNKIIAWLENQEMNDETLKQFNEFIMFFEQKLWGTFAYEQHLLGSYDMRKIDIDDWIEKMANNPKSSKEYMTLINKKLDEEAI